MAKFLTKALETKLIKNYEANEASGGELSHKPVVKFFGGSSCTWLISEYDKENNLYFGLADLGMGFPELGWISREEIESARFQFGLPAERDLYFKADKEMSEYLEIAKRERRIVS